jgi:hypothetical protein
MKLTNLLGGINTAIFNAFWWHPYLPLCFWGLIMPFMNGDPCVNFQMFTFPVYTMQLNSMLLELYACIAIYVMLHKRRYFESLYVT